MASMDQNQQEDIWVKTTWTEEALMHHSVEYRFALVTGGNVYGQGRFITKATNGELSVVIEVAFANSKPLQRLHLSQAEVDAIKPAHSRIGVAFTCYN